MTTMTRQQRRAEQRRKAKGQDYDTMVSDTLGDLFCFGAYYKGDTDEGFGFSFSKETCPTVDMDMIKQMAGIVERFTEGVCQDIINDEISKQEAIAASWDSLKHNIRQFNLDTYGQETQPEFGHAIGNVDMRLVLPVFCDIHFLQEMGEIPVNNQNGMHYGYAKGF
jgi:hypothetical protein